MMSCALSLLMRARNEGCGALDRMGFVCVVILKQSTSFQEDVSKPSSKLGKADELIHHRHH